MTPSLMIYLMVQWISNHPGCKITILEIPLYSIVAWNTKAKHTDVQQFYEQDSDLEKLIIKVNRTIREINEQNNSYSPKFSSDLTLIQKCRKGNKHQPARRVQHRFDLYCDGIHSRPLLSKVWLRKIEQQVIKHSGSPIVKLVKIYIAVSVELTTLNFK